MTVVARLRRVAPAWRFVALAAAVYLVAHLPFLATTLEDVDSINFALGVRDFDPGRHQPHPPGYPIVIALAKAARLVLSEPKALAVWAALFGAIGLFPLLRLFESLDRLDGGARAPSPWWTSPALLATVVAGTAPLYWMSGVRPMSDSIGLAFVAAAQALLVTALLRQSQAVPDARGSYDPVVAAQSARLILAGAFVAALAAGVRSQAVWLTVPLLVMVLLSRIGKGAAGAMIGATVWFALGALVWFVPLVVASGGSTAYLAALSAQAGEDWTEVVLLATRPSVRALADALYRTFIVHWAGPGWAVTAAAVVGAVALLRGRLRTALVLAVAFGPYTVFHLLFQEQVTTRYALPLVVPVAYLAVSVLHRVHRFVAGVTAVVCSVVALVLVVPVTAQYAAHGSPTSRAIAEVRAASADAGDARPTLVRSHAFARALQAGLTDARIEVLHPDLPAFDGPPLPVSGPGAREDWRTWRALPQIVKTSSRPPWVFDTPRHLLLSLVDPSAIRVRRAYRWPFDAQVYLGGVRPSDVDWIEIANPGWALESGWHVSPDAAGRAAAAGTGLGDGPIRASVRARDTAVWVLIGGRHLGAAGDEDVVFTLTVAGAEVDRWTVSASAPFFLRTLDLAAGALASGDVWVPLSIEARGARSGASAATAAVEQFDLQNLGQPMLGYDAGWHEQEYNPQTGVSWRWSSADATLRVGAPGRDVVLRVRGEATTRSFDRPSRLSILAGERVLAESAPAGELDWSIRVTAADLASSGGAITLATDQTFSPAERSGAADRRRLGVRVYDVTVTPVF